MSNYQEGCSLSLEEIAVILSLAGKEVLVGFQPDQLDSLTQQNMLRACCDLMQDQMMTCIDGKFRLCSELVGVMENLYRAELILAVTPSSDLYSQVIYYVAERVTAMEMTGENRYVLTPMQPEDIPADLAERMDVDMEEDVSDGEIPENHVVAEDDRRTLLADAQFLMEQLDPVTGSRLNWLRLASPEGESVLQWTSGGEIRSENLTEENWAKMLQFISGGENRS